MIFKGYLSLEYGGGFASVRTWSNNWDMGKYQGIFLKVKWDGEKFQIRLRHKNNFNGVAYKQFFQTVKNQLSDHFIPFNTFQASFRGRVLWGEPEIEPKLIEQIAIMISDRQEGYFNLEVHKLRLFE